MLSKRYSMHIECQGCCINFAIGDRRPFPTFRKVCDIQGSFAEDFPLIFDLSLVGRSLVKLVSNIEVFENSTLPIPVASFLISETILGNYTNKTFVTQIQGSGGPSKLKMCLQLWGARKVMRGRAINFVTNTFKSVSFKPIKG
jgi:hypothetical protein